MTRDLVSGAPLRRIRNSIKIEPQATEYKDIHRLWFVRTGEGLSSSWEAAGRVQR
jgi:hypothetical protein